MSINIIVNGASGRMGQTTAATIEQEAGFNLVAALDHTDDLKTTIENTQADVVIDFTTAAAVYNNAQTIIRANVRPVIGTSGLLPEQISALQQQCQKQQLGGIIVPNFSIGAVLMMQYAENAAKYLPNVEIIELHHDGKADSPSGTALKTADMIAAKRRENPPIKQNRETIPGARGATHHNIPIHAIRLPGLVAHQEVIFGGVGETLKIRHDSIHRECFMPGVVLACKKVMELKELVYGLESVI